MAEADGSEFDAVADLYERARPRYPDALFHELEAMTGLTAGARVLEVGCGTGQATAPLARRGYRIDCVERGPRLAALARRQLAGYPLVTVHTGGFEGWPAEPGGYDLVLAATSWHWIDPAVGFAKVAAALRPGGWFALCRHEHVSDGHGDEFYEAAQAVYRRCAPEIAARYQPLRRPGDVRWVDVDQTLFEPPAFRAVPSVLTYTAAAYTDLIRTFSPHLAAPAAETACVVAGLAELIDTRFGGRIDKHVLAALTVARRRSGPAAPD